MPAKTFGQRLREARPKRWNNWVPKRAQRRCVRCGSPRGAFRCEREPLLQPLCLECWNDLEYYDLFHGELRETHSAARDGALKERREEHGWASA